MIKFIYRLIINIVKCLFVSLPLQGIGAIILLPYLYFNPTVSKLPGSLRWFDGADQYVGRDTTVYDAVMAQDWLTKYVWLAWRNPINYFSYKYLGFVIDKDYETTEYSRNPNTKIGDKDASGTFIIEINNQGKTYYEYYYIYEWSDTKCFRFRMGWKIGQDINLLGDAVQSVFVISPYHGYTG